MKELNWRDALPAAGTSDEDAPVSALVEAQDGVLVPAMTEEEVLASTASRGKKMVLIQPPSYATPLFFKQIMAAAYQLYMHNNGALPSPEDVSRFMYDMKLSSKVERIMDSPQFRRAMLVRGIDFSSTSRISVEQDMAMAIMASPDGMPFLKKLAKAGVAPSKWRAWLKQKSFREAWTALGASVLTDYEGDMLTALTGQALTGDVQAIKFAFEVSGKHAPVSRMQQVDASLVIAQLIEIVQEEVKDTAILSRIAARMQLVGSTPAARGVIQNTPPHLSTTRPTLAEQTLHQIEAVEIVEEQIIEEQIAEEDIVEETE